MARDIKNTGAVDLKIDSARQIIPVEPDDDNDFEDARGVWLNQATPALIDYHEEDGTVRNGLLLLPGPNMFVLQRILTTSEDAEFRLIY